jgi:multiple sugar transport system permease protein
MKRLNFSKSVIFFLLAFILLLYIFPYAYLMLTSIKPASEAIAIPPTIFPRRLSLENYWNITNYPSVQYAFLNSFIIAVISTTLAIVLSVPAAYAVARFGSWPGRVFLIVALIARMIPPVSVAIPFFALMRTLGLVDTHIGVALAHTTISLPLSVWLLTGFFEGIPSQLEEAARVDGASRFGAFFRVIIPVVVGGIAVTAIFAFLASWNEFLFSLLLTSTQVKTAPLAIAEFKSQYGIQWGTMTSLGILYSLPVIIFSLFMQKRIVSGMTMGAVKG